jgi:hypothetical protein
MSVSTTRKVELIVEAINDVYPEEIDKDIAFKYIKMHNGEYEINQTKFKVVKCNITDVI